FLVIRLAKLQRILPAPPTPLVNALIAAALLSFFLVAFASFTGKRAHDARVEHGELQMHLGSDWVPVGAVEFEQNARAPIRRTLPFVMFYTAVLLLSLSANQKKKRPDSSQALGG